MPRSLTYDDLYAISAPSDPQLSPDGRHVAYVVTAADRETDGYRSSIWVVDVDGTGMRQLTRGPSDKASRWSPDGATLAFVRSVDKAPPQVWLLPFSGGEASPLTEREAGAGTPVWSPDGAAIAFSGVTDLDDTPAEEQLTKPLLVERLGYKSDGAGLIRGKRRHVFVVPAAGGDARQLTEGDFSVSEPVWSPDGRRLAYAAADHDDRDLRLGARIMVVDVESGAPRGLTTEPALVDVTDWRPGELLLCGMPGVGVGHDRLCTLSEDGVERVELTSGYDRNVMPGAPAYPGALPRFDGARVLCCVRDRGATHVVAVPDAGGPVETLVGGDVVVSGLSTSSGRLAYVASTPEKPAELYVDGRQVTELFRSALPDVQLVAPQRRVSTAPDGTTLDGWIVRGDASGPTPLLLDIHGGPHNAWGPAADLVHLYHQTLVAAGWTIAYINPRGSDGYGESFYRAVSGEWGLSDEHDFHAAIDALIADGTADPDRLAVTGYSYGGYMTCWLTARSDRFAAAVTGGCVSNLVSMAGTSDVGAHLARFEGGADLHVDADRLVERSPITYLKGVRTPTLVLHGERDDRCPVGQAEEWFSALRTQGVEVAMVRYPESGHLFIVQGRPSHRIDYCTRVERWVVEHTTTSG